MSDWAGVTTMVTGGAGAIGSHLVSRLQASGARVVVLDDLSSGYAWRLPENLLDFVAATVTDFKALDRACEWRPEVVFHLAALYAHQNSIDHPEADLMVNGLGTWRVFDAARRHGVRRVIYTSSSCIYGDASGPLRENRISAVADTPYQATKLLGEQYAKLHMRSGIETVVARLFNVYGPGDLPTRYRSVVPNFCAAALRGEPIMVHGDGSATRDFTYVDDVVDGLLLCATVPKAVGETFNLGTGRETTIATLASTVLEITGSRSKIAFVPQRPWDTVRRRQADVRKAGRVLGWTARRPLAKGLRETAAWLEQRLAQFESTRTE